ncbi:MAG: hypothetical protein Q8O60_07720, partial [Deltaproteobacteria bacterium]|nr:hypothetical protein [Deltaproteobacteria bacterium]
MRRRLNLLQTGASQDKGQGILCVILHFPPANRWKTWELNPFFHWPEGTGTTDKWAEKGVLSIHKVLR